MEGALVALAMKAGLNPDHLRNEWKRLDEIPFDAAYRIMATLHSGPADEHVIFLKGAPEEVMAVAGVDARLWEQRIEQSSDEHTSDLQSLMSISYAVFCSNKKN